MLPDVKRIVYEYIRGQGWVATAERLTPPNVVTTQGGWQYITIPVTVTGTVTNTGWTTGTTTDGTRWTIRVR